MNIFRLLGDLSHLLSFFFLIHRLHEKKTSVGVSLKTLELYLLVFCTRYLDLFTSYYGLYNTSMKVVYIAASALVVFMIRTREPWKATYEPEHDLFPHWKAAAACAAVSLVFNEGSFSKQGLFVYAYEVMWAFSLFLESVAILPQLVMSRRHGAVENLTSWYMASLGLYRALYVVNWVFRFMTEAHYRAWIPWVTGVVQTAVYADFLYFFVTTKSKGLKNHMILPA